MFIVFDVYLHACVIEKDKNPYTRQRSAPQFRSRGSRLGLSFFTNYIFPGLCLLLRVFLSVCFSVFVTLSVYTSVHSVSKKSLQYFLHNIDKV